MIQREQRGAVAVLRLEHGKVQALDVEFAAEIAAAVAAVERDAATRAVVITGTGTTFSAGVDLKRLLSDGAPYVDQLLPALDAAFGAVWCCSKPTVAAINGHAIAGGLVLAMACDIRVMADVKARIGVPELLVGVPFPWLALEIVRQATSPARLAELVALGATYAPADAKARAMVHEVVSATTLLDHAVGVGNRLAASSGPGFVLLRRQLRDPVLAEGRRQTELAEMVRAVWRDPQTLARIRAYLNATLGADRG